MIWLVFALGLTVGVLLGVVLEDALMLLRSARKENPVSLHLPRIHTPSTRTMLVAGLVVGVLTQVIVGVLLILTYNQTQSYSRCTATWQQEFSQAYQPRARAHAEASEAMDDIVKAVAGGVHTPQEEAAMLVAVDRYLAVRAQQDRDREANPYPPLPQTLCGLPQAVP